MNDFYNKHYIRIREDGCIVDGFSDAFRQPSEEDICINDKGGYQFRLFQGGEENPSLFDWNGIPRYKWDGTQTVERTEEELEVDRLPCIAAQARAQRDKLLADCDWTQTLDAPIDTDTKEAYRVYRQALRDIPQQEGFPRDIIWPELPAKTKAAPDPVDEAVDLLLSGATGEEASA